MSEPCIVQVSAPTAEEAERLGRLAVERRLAACAQVAGPVRSTYRWDGEVTTASEWICTLKTVRIRVDQIAGLVGEVHSYQVPEVVAVPIVGGGRDYLAWVEAESTAP